MNTNPVDIPAEATEKTFIVRAPAELTDRFDLVVQAKYTTRAALVRELMAREVETFFANRPQPVTHQHEPV
jgi:hypothetical protein